jgi:uncharacterized protein YjbJ (UPF0337 family)
MAGAQSQAKGKGNEIAGKVKKAIGKTTGTANSL